MSNGFELYRGPSQIRSGPGAGAPVVLIATGFSKRSSNVKTGGEIQTWILRQDCAPTEAIKSGADAAICGNCPLRPLNAQALQRETGEHAAMCYVNTSFAPNNVYRTWLRGAYPAVDPVIAGQIAKTRGIPIRYGSYGDPAAISASVWEHLYANQEEHTGYTHQWRTHPELATRVMASVNSEREREQAKALGFRTFRVLGPGDRKEAGEILCPATAMSGNKTTCERCQLCSGSTGPSDARKDIAIYDHGPGGMRPGGMTVLPMAGQGRSRCGCGHPERYHVDGAARHRPLRVQRRPAWTGHPRIR